MFAAESQLTELVELPGTDGHTVMSEAGTHTAMPEADPHNGGSEAGPRNGVSEADSHNGGSETEPHKGGSEADPHDAGSETDPHNGGSETDHHDAASETDPHNGGSVTHPRNGRSETDPGVSEVGPIPPLPSPEQPLPRPVPFNSHDSHSLTSCMTAGIRGKVLQLITVGPQGTVHNHMGKQNYACTHNVACQSALLPLSPSSISSKLFTWRL